METANLFGRLNALLPATDSTSDWVAERSFPRGPSRANLSEQAADPFRPGGDGHLDRLTKVSTPLAL
jgi:hypothetical protein